jgi:hypothetical protein
MTIDDVLLHLLSVPVWAYLGAVSTLLLGGVLLSITRRLRAHGEALDALRSSLVLTKNTEWRPSKTMVSTWKSKLTPELKRLDPEAYAKYKRDIATYGD